MTNQEIDEDDLLRLEEWERYRDTPPDLRQELKEFLAASSSSPPKGEGKKDGTDFS